MDIPVKARYRKKSERFGSIECRLDESVPSVSSATQCYNFDMSTGALCEGYGVETNPAVPADARRYWVYRYYSEPAERYVDQYLYQLENGRMMYYDSYTLKRKYISAAMLKPANAVNYRLDSKDVMLISSAGRGLMVWDGEAAREYKTAPEISSMAIHYERLFVTSYNEPTKLFFSDDLNPTNWDMTTDAAGFIEMLDERGEMKKVVSFGNYLYVFREHGISRVTAFADQSEFSAINLYVAAGRIYENSIAVCGSVIIFAASDGLYAFDGYGCTRICKSMDGLIENAVFKASAYCDGKYYLSFAADFGDGLEVGCEVGEFGANALLVYDLSHGDIAISRGLDVSYMGLSTYLDEDIFFACESGKGGVLSRCGKRFDKSLPKLWKSALTDFGTPDKTKTLRELYIDTDVPVTIALDNGKRVKRIPVKAGVRRVRANMSAARLRLSISTDADKCRIRIPTIIYS